ncbi:MAG: DUF4193 family protein [Acidimicrobiia bacterium]
MATEEFVDDDAAEDMPDPDDDIIEEDLIDDVAEIDDVVEVDDDETDEVEAADDDAEVEDEAFDELEAEELEMLTEDETTETLVVDEAAEMRAIRRAELAMDQQGVVEASDGEFVCSSCFLVLKTSQLANPRKKICRDCAG